MIIDVRNIVENYPDIKIRGVIHVGAFYAEEYSDYMSVGIKDQIWVEANKKLASDIAVNFQNNLDVIVYNELIFDEEKEYTFNITNNGCSSSILQLKEHAKIYPHIQYIGTVRMTSKRFDSLIKRDNIDMTKYNLLTVDVQGVDLNVMKSFGDYIKHFNFIITEVNTIEMYEGCNLVHEIDEYLSQYGFSREYTSLDSCGGWGDALYVKRN